MEDCCCRLATVTVANDKRQSRFVLQFFKVIFKCLKTKQIHKLSKYVHLAPLMYIKEYKLSNCILVRYKYLHHILVRYKYLNHQWHAVNLRIILLVTDLRNKGRIWKSLLNRTAFVASLSWNTPFEGSSPRIGTQPVSRSVFIGIFVKNL